MIAPESPIAGAAMVAAGLATLIRLARWRGHLTLVEPLVWSLHLGFVWVPVGLLFDRPQRIPAGRAADRRAARAHRWRDGRHDAGGDDQSHLGPYRAAADRRPVDGRHLSSGRRGGGA